MTDESACLLAGRHIVKHDLAGDAAGGEHAAIRRERDAAYLPFAADDAVHQLALHRIADSQRIVVRDCGEQSAIWGVAQQRDAAAPDRDAAAQLARRNVPLI